MKLLDHVRESDGRRVEYVVRVGYNLRTWGVGVHLWLPGGWVWELMARLGPFWLIADAMRTYRTGRDA